MNELKVHRGIEHQSICQFENYFEDRDTIYIVLELCPNQSLNEMVRTRGKLHELEVQHFLLQIVSAM